jgi:hypothetical protein
LDPRIFKPSPDSISGLQKVPKHSQSLTEQDDKAEYDFQQLKGALISDQALDLPIQDKFQLYVYEKGGVALGVRTQLHGPIPQPVAI